MAIDQIRLEVDTRRQHYRVGAASYARARFAYARARFADRATKAMRAAIALLALSSLLYPWTAGAATADREMVLAATRQRIETLDYRVTGRLIRVEVNGQRTSYKFLLKGHWFPDGLRVLCEITGPAAERTRLLLHMNVNGHVTMEVVPPGSEVAGTLPFERWNERLLGTDLSYEDLLEGELFWKNQELLASAKFGARDCFVLKSVPGAQDRSYYASVTSWIDRDIFYPVHVVKTLRATGLQKDFTYYDLRQSGGVWAASHLEVKLQGMPGSSLLVVERGSGKAKLTRKDFDLGQPDPQTEK